MAAIKCVNKACQWHKDGGCILFPGDFGFLTCKHSNEKTEMVEKTNKKQKGK